jgi:phosphatidylserine/phosphatidylglycerophosphate/cardiolipin synthase-like enzyme
MSLPKDSYILGNLADAARRGVHTRLLLNDPKAFGGGGHFRARRPSMSAAAFHAQEEAASNRHAGHPAAHPPKPERLDPQIETVKFALRLAHCDKIPIDAKIVDTRAIEITYIHNKGMILDDDKVLVSSINGTQNSMDNNREVAIFVQSADAVRYYSEFFEFDWARSPSMDISADLAQNPCDRSLVADAAKGLAGFLSPAAYPPTEGK